MKIGITVNQISYTPEAYAYEKFLIKKGVSVQLENNPDPNNDLNIYFLGLKKNKTKGNCIEIHEYQSLSTAPFAKIKDLAKKKFNCKPDARIFLNSTVKKHIDFEDETPYIYRDMGIDSEFYQVPLKNPLFDIVYCGSILGRKGLLNEIERLAKAGFKLCIIGSIQESIRSSLSKYPNLYFAGKLKRHEIPEIYKNSYAGLNFTPDIYPFNIQTSTKTIEYLASGLQCISNDYFWIKKFSIEREFDYLSNKKLSKPDDLYLQERKNVDVSDLEWNKILENIDFYNFLYNKIRI